MEVGLIRRVDIDLEMRQAYLDYAMSVIVARALPDARDGLKPVHRRILYAMHVMGVDAKSPYKKSARIVGEVLGKYHPHGDMAVYESMARMAQDFSMRYLLIEGQGNFGSVDGDSPAAMRYTEARLAPLAGFILVDIEKNTVEFTRNFDGTLDEPNVLPAALPNLLVNGSTGIAVGMATSIPPHNLGEVLDALVYMLERWDELDDVNVENLMRFIKGPDFPTGGVVIQDPNESLSSVYGSGRGRVTIRAQAHVVEMERGRTGIIVTDLPYLTNKSALIERIAKLARESEIEGIVDLRDESDRQGLRIVIEVGRTAKPEVVLQELYKRTPMQSTFSINMLALVDGEPHLLSLKQALRVYLKHRLEVVRRRSEFDLDKAQKRAHILEGLQVALKNLDEVIALIRRASDADTARTRLMKRFRLSEIQAQAILDMPLRRLAAIERKKIDQEYKEVRELIKALKNLLRYPKKVRQVIVEELQRLKEAFADRRRTHIMGVGQAEVITNVSTAAPMIAAHLIPEQMVWVAIMPDGLISRTAEDKSPRQSGSEAPRWLLRANTRDTLYLVGEFGQTAALVVNALPQAEKPIEGLPLDRVVPFHDQESLAAVFTLKTEPQPERKKKSTIELFIVTVSRAGMVKKSAVSELPGPTAKLFTLVKINEGDRLGCVCLCRSKTDILLVTAKGMAIRFSGDEVRSMGLIAAGVIGIKLQKGDEVLGMEILPTRGEVFLVASDGRAKRVIPNDIPAQGRHGQGIVAWKYSTRTKARLVGVTAGKGNAKITLHLKKSAAKSVRLDDAPIQGRATQGKRIMELKLEDEVIGLTTPIED